MTARNRASWPVYALGALSAGAIVVAVLVVGPASGSQTVATRTATVARGVVQSTVSGSGNLQAANQLNLGFATGGTIAHIYVHQGEHVTRGQLLAALDPQAAEVTLEQSKATLESAEANLAREEGTDGEASTSQSQGASSASAPGSSSTGSTPSTQINAATREANLASARAAVRSDALTVQSDAQAVQDTRLYAPESGTIALLSGQVGEVVSGTGTSRAANGASSSSTTGSSAASAVGAAGTRTSAGTSAATPSESSDSSSSSFAILTDLSSMELVVPLSESEISRVKAGQIATVTVEALNGRKLAARVKEVAILSTSNSGVVSYDVTFQLDQIVSGLKPGMSATAEVVVEQAEGVNVPTSAISGGAVTVLHGAAHVIKRVVTGLAGNGSTIILSGLNVGETVVLPTASTTGASSLTSRLSRLRGGALGGSLGAGAGAGAAAGASPFAGGGFSRGGGG